MIKLTIAIPTFDRYEALEYTLKIIIPQLVDGVELVVLDNASPRAVEGLVHDLAKQHGVAHRVRFLRNSYNIGGNANIIRCFEVAQGAWMWLLGDDDEPACDSVGLILNEIVCDSQLAYINFSSNIKKHSAEAILDLSDLAEDVLFPTYSFMSTGVYRLSAVRSGLIYAYDLAYASAPHLVLMLYSVYLLNMKTRLSPSYIVSSKGSSDAQSYSYQRVKLRFSTLMEAPFLSKEGRLRLAKGVLMATFPSVKNVIVDALMIGISPAGRTQSQARYHFVEYFNRARMLRSIPLRIRMVAVVMNLISFVRPLSNILCFVLERIKKKRLFAVRDVSNRI